MGSSRAQVSRILEVCALWIAKRHKLKHLITWKYISKTASFSDLAVRTIVDYSTVELVGYHILRSVFTEMIESISSIVTGSIKNLQIYQKISISLLQMKKLC